MSLALRVALACAAVAGMCGQAAAAPPADLDRVWLFVAAALAENPEARSATEREAQAFAVADAMAAPLYNPEIEGGFEQFKQDDRRPSKYDFGLSLTVDVSGKRSARGRSGLGQADAAAANARLARLEVGRRLLNAIAALAAGRERLSNAEQQREAAREFSAIASRRYSAGDVGKPDTDIAMLSELDAEAEYRAAEADAFAAEAELRQLCACDPKSAPKLPDEPPPPAQLQEQDLKEYLKASLPVLAARAQVNAAQGELDLANRNRIPDPTISMGVGEDGGQQLYRLTLSIPIPVFNTGDAEARAANRSLAASQLDLNATRREAEAKLRTTYARYVAAFANLRNWRTRGAEAVAARFNQLLRLLKAGDLETNDYLVQLRETLVAGARGIEAEKSAWSAYADWLVLTGTFPTSTGPSK